LRKEKYGYDYTIYSALLLIIEILYLLTVVGIVVVVISENRNPSKRWHG
jgi:hypothetical protein